MCSRWNSMPNTSVNRHVVQSYCWDTQIYQTNHSIWTTTNGGQLHGKMDLNSIIFILTDYITTLCTYRGWLAQMPVTSCPNIKTFGSCHSDILHRLDVCNERKGQEEYFYILCISQSAQAWITRANTPCLPFLYKRSTDGASPNWGKRHPIAAYYSAIDPKG